MVSVRAEFSSGHRHFALPLVVAVFMGLSLEITRARVVQLDECPVGCSSHGACREGLCACAAGWSGQDCSYFLASSGAGEEDSLDEEEDCVDDCSAHGTCGGGVCRCDAGWSGLSCNIAAQCPETCRPPNGQCNAGSCVCAAGFFGPQCGDALCAHNCFGHGSCNSGSCECSPGWFGRLCDSELDAASMCDPPCGNNGQCVSGKCYCGPGFTGIDCSMQVQVTPAQAAALTADAQQSMVEAPAALEMASTAPQEPVRQPMQIRSTDNMANKLKQLEQELQDVQQKTQVLKAKRAVPRSRNRLLMLAQGQVRGRRAATRATHSRQQRTNRQLPVQPPPMHSNLDAVRRATAAAGHAADRLRQTAEKEFHEAAQRRIGHAIEKAHSRAKAIPGYQDLGPTVLPVAQPALTPAPRVQSLSMNFKPFHGIPQAPQVTMKAPDADNEDSADLTKQEALDPIFDQDAEAAQRLRAATNMMVSRSHQLPPPKCEADCGGHGMCIRQGSQLACKCAPGWVGMLCDTQRCENDCNGRGLCLKGHCLCGKGWLGKTCGHVRCPDDCSGVGYCFAGACRCKTGYEGANCAMIRPAGLSISVKMMPLALIKAPPPIDPHFEGMTLRAIPPKACTDNCNGRGRCTKEGECSCNVGYSGLACELFCPNECSHQGDCIEGACLCFAGFLGVDCSIAGCCSGHGTCDDPGTCICDAGWDADDCSVKLMCPDPGCSGHGTCTDGKCHCSAGFSGGSCAIADGGCVPPCGPSGACNPISHKCECAGGAAGPTCLETISSCPDNCNNRGLCMNGNCMCGAGWMGPSCGKKFFKPGQKPPPPAAKPGAGAGGGDGAGGGLPGLPSITGLGGGGPAGGGAAADAGDDAAVGGAAAAGGGEGGAASVTKESGQMVLSKAAGGMICGEGGFCSGHGSCNTALAKCECVTDFFGEVCERQHCPGFYKSGKDCMGNGLCEMGNCQCAPGFGMAPFRLLGAPQPQACMDKVCPVGCGMHGKCVEGQCICQQGWQGPNCKDPQCVNNCAGHGQCVFQSIHSPGQCTCNYGWGGAGCQRVAVYAQLRACPNDCSGNGLCMDGMCACNVGFKGPDCSDILCSGMMTGPKCDQPRCPSDCSGRGLCMNGMCACWSFYAGKDCKIPVACQETCLDLCNVDGMEEKCNNCIGMCESAAPRSNSVFGAPALGVHNPFEDLQSTLLQQKAVAKQPGPGSDWSAMRQNRSHPHHEVTHTKHTGKHAVKKSKSRKHHEVYQRPEKLRHATNVNATGQHPHHRTHHHTEVSAKPAPHPHHHAEVSATPVTQSAF